jgi:transcriptional regulator with XRE-family HTH domain
VTPTDFIDWRKRLGINRAEASRRLGIAPNTVTAYEKGRSAIPTYIALACTAIIHQGEPWPWKPR